MKHRQVRKLTISRETLGRLEKVQLREVAAGGTARSVCACPSIVSFCICETDLCITDIYSNCNLCTES